MIAFDLSGTIETRAMVRLPQQIDDEEHRAALSGPTVSNAALRSSSTSAVTSPWSIAQRMSFMTQTTAVSVLWCRRYADWFDGNS